MEPKWLKEPSRQEELLMDMKWKIVDIAALQETMWNQDATVKSSDGAMIITFKTIAEGYRGLVFYLSPTWAERLTSTKVINARMAVARLKAFDANKTDLAVINVYAPKMMRAKENPEITEAYYQQLRQIYNQERRGTTSTFTLVDLNAKIGKVGPEDANVCMSVLLYFRAVECS